MQASKDCCPKEMQQGNVEKFLCKVFNIDYGNILLWIYAAGQIEIQWLIRSDSAYLRLL